MSRRIGFPASSPNHPGHPLNSTTWFKIIGWYCAENGGQGLDKVEPMDEVYRPSLAKCNELEGKSGVIG